MHPQAPSRYLAQFWVIELASKSNPNNWELIPSWFMVRPDAPLVRRFNYRINGIVYTENTPEFIEAYNKELLWRRLQND